MRLTQITTRTGDKGTTGIADGIRLDKDHPRIAALGTVDELNSHLGVLLAEPLDEDVRAVLLNIQNDLFDLGGALALPEKDTFAESKVLWLDEMVGHYNAGLPPLREFVLPGGSRAGALCHVARTVSRRAERHLVTLMRGVAEGEHSGKTPPLVAPQHALPYLNRLSDLLFVLSRAINKRDSVDEVLWER